MQKGFKYDKKTTEYTTKKKTGQQPVETESKRKFLVPLNGLAPRGYSAKGGGQQLTMKHFPCAIWRQFH